jgi:hypothetical protein
MITNQPSLGNVPELHELARLQARMQRPGQNVNIDGSFELGWGTALLCFASVSYLNAVVPKSIWTSWWTAWIGYLPLLCAAFAPYAIPRLVKRFVTWPRTGYVANPNDVKLIQLVMLMVFGVALGFSLTLPFVLVSEILAAISQPGAQGSLHRIILHGIKLLICATVAVYLGRKVIRKRPPVPAAYDAALINQQLSQSAVGRKHLRLARATLFVMMVGIPLLVCGLVFGLMYLSKSVVRHAEVHWPQLGFITLLVGTNAILYLQGNGLAMKQHRWKWLVLVALLIGPIALSPLIPYPAAESELSSVFEQLPPVMLCIGMLWSLSGAITLIGFVRHNPLPVAERP